MSTLRIGSLFSGIGGLDLAVEAVTGGEVAWFCEADPYARRVLARHWPGVPIFEDVRELSQPPAVDVLCGGFPCQDISNAGKREGIDGEKSGLWREFARLIRDVGPRWVFLENVAAITVRGIGRVLADLARCGFDAEWGCLRACDVGAPHIRNRWFCFGWMADANGQGFRVQHCQRAFRCDADRGGTWPPGHAQEWRDGLPSPGVCRGADGSAHVVDRLRCLGNAVVPQQAAWAFEQLIERAGQ